MKRMSNLYTILFIFAFFLCGCTSNIPQQISAEPQAFATAMPAETKSTDVLLSQMETKPQQISSDETKLTDTLPSTTITKSSVVPLTQQTPPETPQIQTDKIATVSAGENLQVIVFDVGQADCTLVKIGERAMLIDAGDVGQDTLILGYLADHGIKKLDYLVATRPHADHIGSMAAIIRAMDSIGTLLMPKATLTTQTFENLLDAIEEKDVSVSIPHPGDVFEMGSVEIQALAPNSDEYIDLNNYSIVLRIEYGQSVFMFTGDAEYVSENEQLARDSILNADVLKVGHHGSDSSTTQKYLDKVSPSYAVISCGKGNPYGHPSNETVSRLIERGITLYRTDENGSITFTTDGYTIKASVERVAGTDGESKSKSSNTQEKTYSYIGNKNSKKFHLPTCSTLPAEKNRIYFTTRDEAISEQFQPCKNCNP